MTESSSQMSTQPMRETQELCSQELDSSMIDNVWGRLLAMRSNVQVYNLQEHSHTFGRASNDSGLVDHQFDERTFDKTLVPVISKQHFRVKRDTSKGKEHVIIIEDLSSNGTFVNEKLIGKNKSFVLTNNDEISIALPHKKVFMFHDCLHNDAEQYPDQLTEKFTVTKKLGEGTFGEVRLAYKQDNLERCAVKILKKKQFSANGNTLLMSNINQIQNEVELLRSVDHACVVHLYDVIECPEKIYIVMELAEGGELFDRIKKNNKLSEPISKLYCYQLGLAIEYLHSIGISHRDLKPENILMSSDDVRCCIKLTDFGMSKLTADSSIMSTFCGTQMYLAPELLEISNICYDKKVDMWSYGVIVFICLSGCPPFYDKNDLNMRFLIKKGNYSFKGAVWNNVSEEAKDLINHLLVVDPNGRFDVKQCLQHPWFTKDTEMMNDARKLMKVAADPPSTTSPNNHFNFPAKKKPLTPSATSPEAKRRKLEDAITPRITNGQLL